MKVLITTSSFGKFDSKPLDKLKDCGLEVVLNPYGCALSHDQALELYADGVVGVVAGTEPIDKQVIDNAPDLKVISRCGVGLDSVDLSAAESRGVSVYKSMGFIPDAVAELTLGLILNALRNIGLSDRNMRQKVWKKSMGSLLKGKTLGILGLGHIGRRLVELCSAFGVKVLAFDAQQDTDFAGKYDVVYKDLEGVLSQSDIVSLHLPLLKELKGLIDKDKLALMQKHSILINTSRAALIDEQGLEQAIREKTIAGAALDVFEEEPYSGSLIQYDNVILTPHIGSYAKESRAAMESEAVDNLIQGLKEKDVL